MTDIFWGEENLLTKPKKRRSGQVGNNKMAEQQPPAADHAMEELAEGVQAVNVNVPRELGGRQAGRKKGAKKGGRKAGTPNEPRRLANDYFAIINKEEGTAIVFAEAKEGRVFTPGWGYKSDPKTAELYVVAYTDGSYALFRKWANIQPISNNHEMVIKTAYKAEFNVGVE
eukprot:g25031.t1